MNREKTSGLARPLLGILIGVAAALIAAAIFACLFSAILALGAPDGLIPLFAHLTALAAGFTGGFFAGAKIKANGLTVGLLTGIALFVLHFLVTLCFGDITLSCLTFLLAEALSGTLGGIAAVNLKA